MFLAPHMPGIRPHAGNAIFATDFSEYALGAQPFDWTKITKPADFTALVQAHEQSGSISGKCMKMVRTPQSRQHIVWNVLPTNIVDVEMLLLQRKTETGTDDHTYTGLFARGVYPDNTGDTITGYLLSPINDSELRVWKYIAGTATQLGTTNPNNYAGEWFWTRARVVGTSLQIKGWRTTDPEPIAWQSYTNAEIVAGGLAALGNNNFLDVEIGYAAFSIGSPGSPPATIPLPGDIYETDFSEYAVGAQPSDWTKRFYPADFTISVENVAGSISGKALRFTKTGQNGKGASWDKVPSTTDCEILMRARSIEGPGAAGDTFVGMMARASGGASAPTMYTVAVTWQTTSTRWAGNFFRYAAGTRNTVGGSTFGPSPNLTVNTWIYVRLRICLGRIYRKQWYAGTAEPNGWDEDRGAPDITAAGLVGIFADDPINSEIDYFAVSTGYPGGAVPRPIPVPVV